MYVSTARDMLPKQHLLVVELLRPSIPRQRAAREERRDTSHDLAVTLGTAVENWARVGGPPMVDFILSRAGRGEVR